MVTRRTGKTKGAALEMDVAYSLKKKYPDIMRLGQEGFQMGFDVASKKASLAIECKRLKGISWNQLVKYYHNLKKKAYDYNIKIIVFKSNYQPALVFYETVGGKFGICTFESFFFVPFKKHKSMRR